MSLLDQAASLPALRAALDRAVRQRGTPGPDGITLAAFAARAEVELAKLSAELLSGTYQPRPARRVQIPKPGGGYRHLAIGCVRDRVVAHALSATLSAVLDEQLHPFAFAYRRGRSPRQALEVVAAALAEGRQWVLRADIESFFEQIPIPLLLSALEAATGEPPLVAVVERLVGSGILVGGEIVDPLSGTPQGLPLSPLLSNLYLLPFDQAVEAAGLSMVRYGDDLCICVTSRAAALQARDLVSGALSRLRLRLNESKVQVRHLGEGFVFLGFAFTPLGRRPGPQAIRSLVRKVEAVLAERPTDGGEEIDALLRGWLGYYGSLAGVQLPAAVRARAEALEAHRVQALQGQADSAPEAEGERREAAVSSPYAEAARSLRAARGAPEEAALHERLRAQLRIDPAMWPALADALIRGDGGAAAELLARAGRFGDAMQAAQLVPPAEGADAVAPATPDWQEEPRLAPRPEDAERLLELFGGAEHVFVRDLRQPNGVVRERVAEPPTVEHVRQHLEGAFWMGCYPLRANRSVRFAAVRVVAARRARGEATSLQAEVTAEARRLLDVLGKLGLPPVVSLEPARGYVLWVLFSGPVSAARARALVLHVLATSGEAGPGVTREVVPAQEVTRPDRPGTGILWPLGRDPRTGQRAWLLDESFRPLPDQGRALQGLVRVDPSLVARILNPSASVRPSPQVPPSPSPAGPSPVSPVQTCTSPFVEQPRAQQIYAGCNVFRYFVDQAVSGRGLASSERHFVADVLGRLGSEAEPALEAVFRHLDDYRPGLGARHLLRIYPYPTSCARIRSKLPELTARVGCDCRFRLPPGSYPTPVLHALGAAEVPGLSERVQAAAARGGLARAAMAAMNEGRKELGQKASALCARLADLRRQARMLERTIASVEGELDAVLDEAGDEALETPSGVLRRVREGGVRRFILEV
ncbi:MAG: reverse transcriptase domain-containing protein [Myxococcales bacterium]|nr:reverse transcriptase domain-containing protein [Myxococcota bacterium]MDW8284374.1 reverse transcriptase domain-containing protein [Myxococcales bacterium]